MAYQARVAIEKTRFVIEQTEQFAGQSDQGQEIHFQLLDALDRLESIERRFQVRSRFSESGQQLKSRRDAGKPEWLG
jgi:hypothetical protein